MWPRETVGVNPRSSTDKPRRGVDLTAFVDDVVAEVARRGSPEDALAVELGPVSLENLWAGWRHDYIQEATERERAEGPASDEQSCVFCRLAESGPPSLDNLVVWRGDWSFVVLNAYPYGSGHVLVLPCAMSARWVTLTDSSRPRSGPPRATRSRRSRGPTNPTG